MTKPLPPEKRLPRTSPFKKLPPEPALPPPKLDFDPVALQERIRTDERFFAESCLHVINRHTSQLIPYKANAAQRFYEGKRGKFNIITKARRLGLSTRILIRKIWRCAFKENRHMILLCQDKDATKKMFEEKVKPIIENSLYPLGAIARSEYIHFPRVNSRFYIGTAGTKKFGRGSDITDFLLSEVAHWPDAEVITGVEEGCLEDAEGDIETTANGANFYFHMWKRAQAGESRYTPIFIPWWLDEGYVVPGAKLSQLTEYEHKLIEGFSLSHEQLAWYREKARTMSQPELIAQEYPSFDGEAFIFNERMVFDFVGLQSHEKRCAPPKWRGYLRDNGESITFQPQEQGGLRIWGMPVVRHVYAIGADVAEGIPGECYSAAVALDVGTSEVVAEWHGHIPPDQFADILASLATFYNSALLVPESWPGVGAVTTSKLVDLGYRHIYRREAGQSKRSGDQLLGWETTVRTRTPMLLDFAAAVRDYDIIFYSKDLLDEMRSFVYTGSDMQPQAGCFSDRVMAAGIVWAATRQIAASTQYHKPRLREIEQTINRDGGVTMSDYHGPRYGYRRAG